MTISKIKSQRIDYIALSISIFCWLAVACAIVRCYILSNNDTVSTLFLFFEYLTHWTAVYTAIVFTIITFRLMPTRTWWLTGQCLIMNVSTTIGYWSGTSWNEFIGQYPYLQYLHGVLPIAAFVYWVFYINHPCISIMDSTIWLAAPLAYTAWMETYGYIYRIYPYDSLNPFITGRLATLISIAEIFAISALTSYSLYVLDRLLLPPAKRSIY